MENERLKQMLDGAEEPSAEGLKKIVEQQQVELERQKVELESKDGAIQLLAEKMPEAERLTLNAHLLARKNNTLNARQNAAGCLGLLALYTRARPFLRLRSTYRTPIHRHYWW